MEELIVSLSISLSLSLSVALCLCLLSSLLSLVRLSQGSGVYFCLL